MDMSAINEPQPPATATVECPFCAERIAARARKCRHCGETVDVALRKAEEAMRASERSTGNVYMNAAVAAPDYSRARPEKSRGAAILLALFLGGIGGHKFYLNRTGQGLLYLVFCWTFIPGIIALVEMIIYACTSDESFHYKYG
jgi:TM2 domain-containing membrane protein YozV